MTTYKAEQVPPEKRRTKPGTAVGRQRFDHTGDSHVAMLELAQAVPCSNAEAVRKALLLVSPKSLELAEALAKRWETTPREALERALGDADWATRRASPRPSKS